MQWNAQLPFVSCVRIASRQVRQVEAFLDKVQDRSRVHWSVRDLARLGEEGYHNHRNAEAGSRVRVHVVGWQQYAGFSYYSGSNLLELASG